MLTRPPTRWFSLVLIAIALLAVAAGSVHAQGATPDANSVIPLEGLDPVMLSEGKEVQGDMKYQVTRGRFRYIFANAQTQATFEKDPSRYEIQLNGSCARMGAPTTGNPDLYAVHKERIYVFGSEECQTVFKAAPEKYLEVPVEPKSPPSPTMVKRGGELIAKAVDALGGMTKLDQLVSFQRKEVRGNDVKNTLLLGFPNEVRQETVRPNFTLVSVVSPTESFVVVNNTTPRPMSEANRVGLEKELLHEPIVLLRARSRPDFKVWDLKEGNDPIELVEVELSGFRTTLAIDPVTGRVLGQIYRGRGPGGVVGEIEINYSDFRGPEKGAEKGPLLPFKIVATFDGQPYPALSATIEASTINGQFDPASFKKPIK